MDTNNALPVLETFDDQNIGIVQKDGELYLNLGGGESYQLKFHDHAELEDGKIQIEMYTIIGDMLLDVADITVLEGGTPFQNFISDRVFVDIPLEGRAKYIAQSPTREIYTGEFDSTKDSNQYAMFGKGWVVKWIVPEGETFRFIELCVPRFIDKTKEVPVGEEGIVELDLDDSGDRNALSANFFKIFGRLVGETE